MNVVDDVLAYYVPSPNLIAIEPEPTVIWNAVYSIFVDSQKD